MIYTFVKDRKGRRVGVVVALSKTEIGWSLLSPDDPNRFDKEMALKIAIGRAKTGKYASYASAIYNDGRVEVPYKIKPMFEYMEERARRYFK